MFKKIFFSILKKCPNGKLKIIDNGKEYFFGKGNTPSAEISIFNQDVFKETILHSDIGLGETYVAKKWDTPDLTKVLEWFIGNRNYLPDLSHSDNPFKQILNQMFSFYQRIIELNKTKNSFKQSRKNISYHYDLNNDFFELMLDKTMAYSSACFDNNKQNLYQGQINKFKKISTKLLLKKTDHLLEIGSGWGGFAVYVAKKYGCKVTTLTLSEQQYQYVKTLIKKEKLEKQVEVRLKDYRKVEGKFDKLVSIEMIEAIGYGQLDTFCRKCTNFLKEKGIMVIQMITFHDHNFSFYVKNINWIQKYIFPGSHLISIVEFLNSMRKFGQLTVSEIESIGQSYANTLKIWNNNCQANQKKIKTLGFDDTFFRKWHYYLVSCEVAFRLNYINDIQMTLINHRGVP